MVEILKDLKPRFIHHPESKRFLHLILAERGCDPEDIYFDVPRLRSSTSDGYLTSGIAYAWHPHRDTWYSAPRTQLNWWIPIYPIQSGNGMCFYFDYFDRNVPNNSDCYNYQEWNQKFRFAAADQVKRDERPLPQPHDNIPSSHSTTLVTPVGGLVIFFSSAIARQRRKYQWSHALQYRFSHNKPDGYLRGCRCSNSRRPMHWIIDSGFQTPTGSG